MTMLSSDSLIHLAQTRLFPNGNGSDASEPFEVLENPTFIVSSGLAKGETLTVQTKIGSPCAEDWADLCPWHLCCKATSLMVSMPGWYRLKFESKNLNPDGTPVLNEDLKVFIRRGAMNGAMIPPTCGCKK